jgi:GT2 family glycosyltransferase
MEVLVMANACTDGTLDIVRQYQAPFTMQIFERPDQGPGAARNHGASCATGWLLIFLDDDIEPATTLVEAHVRTHQKFPKCAVIGYTPPVFENNPNLFQIVLRGWWEDKFNAMREPGHRYTFRDMLSGNMSLTAELFDRVGGFDPGFRSCFDDFELGVRLLQAGTSLILVDEAVGRHHETKTLDGLIRRKYHEAIADIMLGRRYPELRPTLVMARLSTVRSRSHRLMRACAFRCTPVGDLLANGSRYMLRLLAWVHLRRRWRRLLDRLMMYWYWRGIATELGTERAVAAFLEEHQTFAHEAEVEVEIDLLDGLSIAEQILDEKRPESAYIRYGEWPVCYFPSTPGAEPLCGRHLRPLLAKNLTWPLFRAFILETTTKIQIDTPYIEANREKLHPLDTDVRASFQTEGI